MSEELDEVCRQRAGKDKDWSPYSFTCLPRGSKDVTHIEITGARHKIASRGPRKGHRMWTTDDRSTIILSVEEYSNATKAPTP